MAANSRTSINIRPTEIPKDLAIDAIAIMEQIGSGRVPREGLGNLLCRPFRGGMGSDVEMNHTVARVGQNHKDEEDSKVHRRHHKEIRRDQLL